jgi:mRNA interferase RelE/StbE
VPRNLANQLFIKIEMIAQNPYTKHNNVKLLKGSPYYRLSVGDWRVIYEIQDEKMRILVLRIASQGEVFQ